MIIKQLIKPLVPRALWQHLRQRHLERLRKRWARDEASKLYSTYFRSFVDEIRPSILATGETHNFTYDLTPRSLLYLANTIGMALRQPVSEVEQYIQEAIDDADINTRALKLTPGTQVKSPFGRRLGWYAIARMLKPKVIVETGVERGHGSLILCAALLRNTSEGFPGRYYGTDIRQEAGQLLVDQYKTVGEILYGDSISSLHSLDAEIDLFINDSDHSADYEYREYQAVLPKLSQRAVILGDNAHYTDRLALFSRETGRLFAFFKEDPLNHWYPGAGIGISVKAEN